jgi:hypothetical protein
MLEYIRQRSQREYQKLIEHCTEAASEVTNGWACLEDFRT